jgi:CBS domain-containing protein
VPDPRPPIAVPLAGVSVLDAMRPGVITCLPDASLSTVGAIMATHGIHSVVLSQSERGIPLIVTDLDFVRTWLEGGEDGCAADIARVPAATLSTDASLEDAVAAMAVGYVAHLLATDPGSGAAVGIISCFDVAAVVGGCEPRLARILRPEPATLPVARTLGEAKVSDVIHRGIVTCPRDTPLSAVARSMAERRIHCVAVASVDGTSGRGEDVAWGLIEDLDLVVALHRGALAAPAATVAETAPVALPEGASLDRAAALMVEHDTRHVVAVAPSGLPRGMVSTLDVALILAWSK